MTDEELTPEQDDAVRRLLAQARHDEPVPEDVALRLDEALAGLSTDAQPSVVVPLRHRRWPKVLVAAAAVCAIGLGATQVVGGGGSDDAGDGAATRALLDSDDTATGQDEELGDVPAAAPDEPTPANGFRGEGGDLDALDYYNLDRVSLTSLSAVARQLERSDRGPLQVLARDHLPSKLRKLGGELGNAPQETGNASGDLSADAAYDARIAPLSCGPLYTVVGGKATYATYHRKLALVIFHPEVGGTQLVELYICSGRTPRRSVERVTLWDGE